MVVVVKVPDPESSVPQIKTPSTEVSIVSQLESPETCKEPIMCKVDDGVVVPIPTLLFVGLTKSVPESTFKPPELIAPARVSVPVAVKVPVAEPKNIMSPELLPCKRRLLVEVAETSAVELPKIKRPSLDKTGI